MFNGPKNIARYLSKGLASSRILGSNFNNQMFNGAGWEPIANLPTGQYGPSGVSIKTLVVGS